MHPRLGVFGAIICCGSGCTLVDGGGADRGGADGGFGKLGGGGGGGGCLTQGGMGCAGIGTGAAIGAASRGAGTGSAVSASVLTVGALGDGVPAGAGFVVVFTLIGDGVSGGVGEASSISSFGLIMDAGVAHFLSPGLIFLAWSVSWPGVSGGRASAGLVGVEQRWMSQGCLVLEEHHLPWHPVGSSIGLPWSGRARTVVWRMPQDLVCSSWHVDRLVP